MQESIAAIATASGTGGVAIIRISGENSLEIAGSGALSQISGTLLNHVGEL